jgi:GrpB-like predicted nucleotidyltransferase (UPF0157 family)
MVRKIQVNQHNVEYFDFYNNESAKIKKVLNNNLIEIHHVGSTAVFGLYSKPKLDIIAVVHNQHESIQQLKEIDYVYKGEWNIPFKYGFTKRGDLDVNLHVYNLGHPEIELNIRIRDYLISNENIRKEYSDLKQELVKLDECHQQKTNIFRGYNLGKDPFFVKLINLINFNEVRFLFCSHYREQEEYLNILYNQIYKPLNLALADLKIDFSSNNNYYFIICLGANIIGIANVELISNEEAILNVIAIKTEYTGLKYGSNLLDKIEKWLITKQIKTLHISNSNLLNSERFFYKNNYNKDLFKHLY